MNAKEIHPLPCLHVVGAMHANGDVSKGRIDRFHGRHGTFLFGTWHENLMKMKRIERLVVGDKSYQMITSKGLFNQKMPTKNKTKKQV